MFPPLIDIHGLLRLELKILFFLGIVRTSATTGCPVFFRRGTVRAHSLDLAIVFGRIQIIIAMLLLVLLFAIVVSAHLVGFVLATFYRR